MIETIRKIGLASKGTIYSFIGLLTFLSILGVGGKVSGKSGVFHFLENQIFGSMIILIISIGLIFYAVWRILAAFADKKNKGDDKKGKAKRVGYFVNGIIYGALAISLFTNGISKSNESNNSKENMALKLMDETYGIVLLYTIAIVLFVIGVIQVIKGYQKKFLNDIEVSGKQKNIVTKLGQFGFISRGISFLIFAYFVAFATLKKNPEAIKGVKEMFLFLRGFSWSNILMALMALGFLAYGLYQFCLAIYSSAD
jgi:hypothetical protein